MAPARGSLSGLIRYQFFASSDPVLTLAPDEQRSGPANAQ
jgi:hypothetical protein